MPEKKESLIPYDDSVIVYKLRGIQDNIVKLIDLDEYERKTRVQEIYEELRSLIDDLSNDIIDF